MLSALISRTRITCINDSLDFPTVAETSNIDSYFKGLRTRRDYVRCLREIPASCIDWFNCPRVYLTVHLTRELTSISRHPITSSDSSRGSSTSNANPSSTFVGSHRRILSATRPPSPAYLPATIYAVIEVPRRTSGYYVTHSRVSSSNRDKTLPGFIPCVFVILPSLSLDACCSLVARSWSFYHSTSKLPRGIYDFLYT